MSDFPQTADLSIAQLYRQATGQPIAEVHLDSRKGIRTLVFWTKVDRLKAADDRNWPHWMPKLPKVEGCNTIELIDRETRPRRSRNGGDSEFVRSITKRGSMWGKRFLY